ncbi:3-isopropylmalate dehydratase small subunit [Acidisphaera sp. L21]|uniref:3-isopropylmalate dehydratase small subunit n=1 Tax=Acidisphaera sp. L21 TaxID=1641851 RepID=UPI00131D5402|nr:3-isopropylmalate dehydratase small subunit [Acidisphaera sp. L21]
MQAFTTVSGAAAPLMRDNIDTDMIIRIERMTGTTRDSMGQWALEALRYRPDGSDNPDFVLNQPAFRDAPILVAGANFGCGSSREAAVWALMGAGLRCVIAPSFGDIFFNNCFQNGMLPVRLPSDDIARLADACAGGNARVSVDLHRQVVVFPHGEEVRFEIEPLRRDALLEGLDEIGLTLKHAEAIAAFQAADRIARPFVWQPGA